MEWYLYNILLPGMQWTGASFKVPFQWPIFGQCKLLLAIPGWDTLSARSKDLAGKLFELCLAAN